jgi:hypothetical protein
MPVESLTDPLFEDALDLLDTGFERGGMLTLVSRLLVAEDTVFRVKFPPLAVYSMQQHRSPRRRRCCSGKMGTGVQSPKRSDLRRITEVGQVTTERCAESERSPHLVA